MSTQTRIRRGTASQIDSMTPAADEVISDTTNKRLRKGDGLTAGGIHLPNYIDNRTLAFNRGVVGGTPNDITLTLGLPIPAYSPYLSFTFIATNTNTGVVTMNVDGKGPVTIRKVSSGAIADLAAGDIVAGGMYEIAHDGTYFQLKNITPSGLITVRQGDLATSTGAVGVTVAGSLGSGGGVVSGGFTGLPGGEYGFHPTVSMPNVAAIGFILSKNGTGYGAALRGMGWSNTNTSFNSTLNASQRYITSSPPFDMGEGEAGGFIYLEMNNADEIVSYYIADVPPWAYNGPTNIRADFICPATGKKFRRKTPDNLDLFINKRSSFKVGELEEITMEMKNRDMSLIPHPFENNHGNKILMIDPMDDKVRSLIDYQNMGGIDEVVEKITKGYITLDNSPCKRCGPKGVAIHKMKYKFKKK